MPESAAGNPAAGVFQEKMGMGVRALPGNAFRPGCCLALAGQ